VARPRATYRERETAPPSAHRPRRLGGIGRVGRGCRRVRHRYLTRYTGKGRGSRGKRDAPFERPIGTHAEPLREIVFGVEFALVDSEALEREGRLSHPPTCELR
jgi:hypothetical protein